MIKQNILHFLDYKGITKYTFYKNTGITRGILDQDNGISEDNIAKFLAYFTEVNVEWLITGNGNMLSQEGARIAKKNNDKVGFTGCTGCADKERIIKSLQTTIDAQQTTIHAQENLLKVYDPGHKQTASG